MNKITSYTAFIAGFFILLAAIQPASAAAAGNYSAKVQANSLNVRSEPAAGSAIKGSLKNGVLVTVTDEDHGWLKVRAGSTSGWVAGYYLKKVNGSGQASGSVATNVMVSNSGSVATKGTVTANSLRIRSGPGTHYNVLGSLQAPDSVTIIQRQSGWIRIRTVNGGTGWVAEQYVRSGSSKSSIVRSSGGLSGKLIIIDPGHGGSDPGMLGTTYNTMEKDLNLQTAIYVRDYLESRGARVEMTRTRNNQKPSLAQRVQFSEALGADAFVSIHYNSSPKKVSGTLTFFYSEADDLLLARAIETRLGQGIGLKSNGLSFGDYRVLRGNRLPAALIELGFLTNPTDEAIVRKTSYQKKAAKAIADGLADYFRR
ncbi:N-acetylmuramoyl-L-alanine amidase [Paenibacillus sp. 19GGS1-52]|uniref:N-acetylmuramoyl-L-alanine amidase n=1 Tax=Paenibacillus sp. 19GGS1-52 TaxID=2758563 RepID=UPI001EFB161F|nr:N-acetylmuramoyl-L-alanine amidase [Paenibacillus sp. 19GGS1-52]ULO08214.1 N-acetylmuramoyl-L-alanine amidase [Paenibacillus sp. 19GGS1-52]